MRPVCATIAETLVRGVMHRLQSEYIASIRRPATIALP
jgi:hypothetical protein